MEVATTLSEEESPDEGNEASRRRDAGGKQAELDGWGCGLQGEERLVEQRRGVWQSDSVEKARTTAIQQKTAVRRGVLLSDWSRRGREIEWGWQGGRDGGKAAGERGRARAWAMDEATAGPPTNGADDGPVSGRR